MKAFDEILPAQWSHNNPVDILGDAEPERYAKSLEIAAKDPSIDGMLVILTPQDMTNPTQIAEKLKPYAKGLGKPVLASWMGGAEVAAGEQILNQAGIPTFQFPDSAVRAFNYMWRYSYNLKGLYETPALPQHADAAVQRGKAEHIIQRGPPVGPHHPDRVRIEAVADGLRHSDGRDPDRGHRGGSAAGGGGDRLSHRPEAVFADHHAQDRRRRRAAESARCRGGEDAHSRPSSSRSPRRPAPSTSRA